MTDPSLDTTPSELTGTHEKEAAAAPASTDVPETPHGDVLVGEEIAPSSLLPELDERTPVPVMGSLPTVPEQWTKGSLPYRTGFFLASMVGGLSSVCIKQLLLPIQVSQLAPRSTATSFALIASVGACAGLIASPLSGALSDRTISRWGRRRPWIIGGTLLAAVGLLLMAVATTVPALLIGEVLAQIGVDTILATITALIPDQIPEPQRAGPSALNGMAPIVGGVLGLVLVTRLTAPNVVWQGYVLLAAVSVGCIGLFLLILREQPVSRQDVAPFAWRAFLASFFQPLGSRDFRCTFLSRALVFLSFTLLGSYLFFDLSQERRMPVADAAQAVTTFQLLSTGSLILIALLASMLAQRWQRLKPCIVTGALVMAGSLLLLVIVPTWRVLLLVAVLFGGGFGAVLGVDIALAIQVLPKATDRGKDLGLMMTAIFLPLIVSPIIGAVILNTVHSFTALFLVAAVSSVLAAVVILPIKAVR
ncbi:MAG TPA: MFS transporter [Ktedonobacteraceae bacterium]|nr:MFS transporter [Ktedonobacteraceae bacterium]